VRKPAAVAPSRRASAPRAPFPMKPVLETLEPRLLLSADLFPVAPDLAVSPDASAYSAAIIAPAETGQTTSAALASGRELVFVDPRVPESQALLAALLGEADGRKFEIITLDANRDGIVQVTAALKSRMQIDAVHFITHGSDGAIQLGGTLLDAKALAANKDLVGSWAGSLKDDADLLFYGCDLASTARGRALVDWIAELTGADVAASTDKTGIAARGGDWELEYRAGNVETRVALDRATQLAWNGILATVGVNTTLDVRDGDTSSISNLLLTPGADGLISLREAIVAANNTSGADVITLVSGLYRLTLTGAGEDNALTGDLDVTGELTITGAGANSTFIDGVAADRVFDVKGASLTLSGVTIQNGFASGDGGGVYLSSNSGSALTIHDAALTGNTATGKGGAIYSDRALSLDRVTIDGNGAAEGGGVYLGNDGSSIATLANVTISNNTATGNGGGIHSNKTLTVTSSTISGNAASDKGGGLYSNGDSPAITNSTIAYNSGSGGAGGIHFEGSSRATLKNTILAFNTGGNANGAQNSLGNNIESANTAGLSGPGDQINTDPLLGLLQYNGGPTKTHALLPGSPAIDAGTSVGAPATDQRGATRVGTPDIGAYEFGASVNQLPTGAPTISGTAQEDQTLTALTDGIADPDGLGPFAYQWERSTDGGFSWAPILGATTVDYPLDDPDVGTHVRVVVAYTDGGGTLETLASAAVGPVANVVDHLLVVDTEIDAADAPDLSSIDALLKDKGIDGRISLREAIIAANNTVNDGSPDRIHFDIAGPGIHTITALGVLPTITDGVIIDATTDPDFAGVPIIELSGASVGPNADGLVFMAGASEVRGLIINRWGVGGGAGNGGTGIIADGTAQVTIRGNYIGTDAGGNAILANGEYGIKLLSDGNVVGGATAADRNVISGNNEDGIYVAGSAGNVIQGNYIGTNANGTVALGNLGAGIWVHNATGPNTIGGVNPGEGNVVSGNGFDGPDSWQGVLIQNSDGNLIQGNIIGLNATGTAKLANAGAGIELNSGSDNNLLSHNVISGNTLDGVVLWNATGNTVSSNLIGTDAAGTGLLGNGDYGVWITDAANNTIGGLNAGDGNVIAGNGFRLGTLAGIEIDGNAATGNALLGNRIYANAGLAIDIDGGAENALFVTANDPGDGDGGPNRRQNYPVLTAAVTGPGGLLQVSGTLNSTANRTFRIELFASATADPSGYGEGERFLGAFDVMTDAAGNVTFTEAIAAVVAAGEVVSATATNLSTNDTSEFAENEPVTVGAGGIAGRVLHDVDGDADVVEAATLAFAGARVDLYLDDGDGVIDADDILVDSRLTDGAGLYSFGNLFGGAYYVVVDSKSLGVTPGAWAEQTFATAGAAQGGTFTVADGALYGGLDAGVSDDATSLLTAQHVTRVNVGGANVAGVDYGFSFDVVTSVRGDANDDDASRPGVQQQGTLRQFILNANAIGGTNAMRFVPAVARNDVSGTWWEIAVTGQALPSITGAGTTIDGTAYEAIVNGGVRDTNAGLLGTGGTVGVGNLLLSQVERPELEIVDGGGLGIGLEIAAPETRIRDLAIYGFGTDTQNGDIVVRNVDSTLTVIEGNLIGMTADGLDPGGSARSQYQGIHIDGGDGGTVRNNLIGHTGRAGINLNLGATGWTIAGNEIRGVGRVDSGWDGINLVWNSSATIVGNLIADNLAPAIDVALGSGNVLIENNTITGNAAAAGAEQYGIDFEDSTGTNVVRWNVISGNTGPGVLVGLNASGVRITENLIFDNTGLGIDHNPTGPSAMGDGVTPNDSGRQNYPVLATVTTDSFQVTITGALDSTPGRNFLVEFFSSAVADPSGHGEAERYLGATPITTDGAGNAPISVSLPVTLALDQFVTATATDLTTGETSEFALSVASTPPNTPPVADDVVVTGNEDDASIAVVLTATDAEGAIASFRLLSLPANGTLYTDAGLTAVAATGVDYAAAGDALALYFVPDAEWSGTTSFQFTATDLDGLGDATPATAAIDVAAVNDAPTVSTIADQTIDQDGTLAPLPFTVGDVETAAGSLVVTAMSSNPALVPDGNIVLGGSGANRTIGLTPAAGQYGSATITVSVSDGTDTTLTTFVVTVNPQNALPLVTDATFTVQENAANGTAVGTVSATDPDPEDSFSKIYWTDLQTGRIYRANYDGTGAQVIVSGLADARGIEVDYYGGKIYWTDYGTNRIQRANLDGSNVENIITTGLTTPTTLRLDTEAGKIYWVDEGSGVNTGSIKRANLDGTGVQTLLSGLATPKGLDLDVAAGKMYYVENGLNRIRVANMDGTGTPTTLVSGLSDPWSLSLDVPGGKMYWTDRLSSPGNERIGRANLDGSAVQTSFLSTPGARDVMVDASHGKLYWTDQANDRLRRANLDGTSTQTVVGLDATFGNWDYYPSGIVTGPAVPGLTYSITGGNAGGAFAIDPVSGAISVASSAALDYETTPTFALTVQAQDAGGMVGTGSVTVNLTNVNEAPAGAVTISGLAQEDETLVADTSGITDPDGLGPFAYQWERSTDGGFSWAAVGGATTAAYLLGDADVGTHLRVIASYVDGGGTLESLVSATVGPVANVNDAPVVTTSGGALDYTENDPATPVDPALSVSDLDNTALVGATVRITGGYASGEDLLSFTPAGGITGAWDSPTGTLTLSGPATLADWQTVLQSVAYQNTSDDPTAGARTIELVVNDGAASSAVATRTVDVTAVNDAPVASAVAASGDEDDAWIPVTLTGSDVDDPIASFRIVGPLPANGVLYLDAGLMSPAASGDDYPALGNALTLYFVPTADWSGTTAFQFTATDEAGATSAVADATITVNAVNDAPVALDDGPYAVDEDASLSVGAAAGVLANDSDVDSPSFTAVLVAGPANAVAFTLYADGSFDYTPRADFFGTDTFTYQAFDGSASSGVATATITVNPVADSTLVVDTAADYTSASADWGDTSSIDALLMSKGADGLISLREAIVAANNSANGLGPDLILFDIAGAGVHTINLLAALPTITDAVIIDGWSEPDFAGAPVIELNGAGAGAGAHGLTITAGGSTVRGLVIHSFGQRGVSISGGGGNTIAGNYIGTDATGSVDLGNGFSGIFIDGSANNVIGGGGAADRNVISGNNFDGVSLNGASSFGNQILGNYIGVNAAGTSALGNGEAGVDIDSGAHDNLVANNVISGNAQSGVELGDAGTTGNVVRGNLIGTNAAGTGAIGNADYGIWLAANDNVIGGPNAGDRNVVSGSGIDGIFVDGASGNVIQGNYIGTNAAGTAALGNTEDGIWLQNASNTLIGGTAAGEGNLISGNDWSGIAFTGGGSGNVIQGNAIGVDATGGALGNLRHGVQLLGSNGTLIGGTAPGAGNFIAHNGLDGVSIETGTGHSVLGNTMRSNGGLGIDIGNNGVTANDAGDLDGGPNLGMNTPVIYGVLLSAGNVTVTGEARPGATIEIFRAAADPSGHGEGETLLWTEDATGVTPGLVDPTAVQFSFTFPAGPLAAGDAITATATDAGGSTSEFSANAFASTSPPGITVTPISGLVTDENGGTAAFTVVLDSQPGADVTIALASSNTAEGTVAPAPLVFASANWNVAQTVTVTGVADFLTDGDVAYSVLLDPATSADAGYNGLDPADVTVTNLDGANDAPVIVVPGAQIGAEDVPFVFSTGAGNAISISDSDAGPTDLLEVTLTATQGLITLAGTAGLTFSAGTGTAETTMTFTGTLADVNAALDGLTITTALDFIGTASLAIAASDLGASGAGGPQSANAAVDVDFVAVNDAPTIDLDADDSSGASGADFQRTYTEQSGARLIVDATAAVLGDVDSANLASLTVAITNPDFDGAVEFLSADTTGTTITAIYNALTGVLTLNGADTVANYELVLRTVRYENTSDTPSANPRLITFVASDGGAASNVATATVTIAAVNDAPTASIAAASYAAVENAAPLALHGTGMAVGDIDALPGSIVDVYLSSISGLLSATAGTTGVVVAGSGSPNLTFTGTLAQVNALLAGAGGATITYVVGSDSPAPTDTLWLGINDRGATGSGGALWGGDSVTVDLTAVNDAPIITIPGATSTPEDTPLVFSAGGPDQISITDVDAAGATVEMSLSVTNGRITLAGTGGLTFTVGTGTAETAMTFTGTVADINTALDGLVFAPTPEFNGSAFLSVSVNDQGNSGLGGPLTDADFATITVTAVNDVPDGADATVTTPQDTPYVFGVANFGFTDGDAGDTLAAVRIDSVALPAGATLQLSGVDIDVVGMTNNTVAVADITAGNLVFTPAPGASGVPYANFTFSVQDSGGAFDASPNTLSVNVATPVNTPPAGTDATITTTEGTDRVFTVGDFGFTDPDAGDAMSAVQIDTLPTQGSLLLSGFAVSAGQTIAAADIALGNLVFSPVPATTGIPYASFTFTVFDTNGPDLDPTPNTLTVNVTAPSNDPVNTVPGAQVVNEDTALAIAGISVSDPNGDLASVQLGVGNGTLSATAAGLASLVGSGSGAVTITGSQADINATLASLVYQGTLDFAGTDALTIVATDSGGATDTDTVDITVNPVNDAPTVSMPAGYAVTEGSFLALAGTGLVVGDVDAGAASVTVMLSVNAGLLQVAGPPSVIVSGSGTPVVTLVGPVADINALLAVGMVNYFVTSDAPPATDTLTVTIDDNGASGAGGPRTASASIPIAITAVNDAPVNTLPGGATTLEDTPLVYAGASRISVTDVDAGAAPLQVTLNASNGVITLGGVAGLAFAFGDGTADASMRFTGTVAAINAALDGLVFTPDLNYWGLAFITMTTDDLGASGAGGAQTDSDLATIDVLPVNDAPDGTDTTVTAIEDTPYTFTLSRFGFTDVDAVDGDAMSDVRIDSITLPAGATLQLSGVDVAAGQIITVADINAGNLVFTPVADANGPNYASFTFSVRDAGIPPGPLFDPTPNTMTIDVAPVNDAPIITSDGGGATATFVVAENSTAVTTVTASDVDLQPLTFSISGGADAARFTIDAVTGVLAFAPAPNFEAPADVGANNVYDVTVQVSDGFGGTDTQALTITVTDVDDAPFALADAYAIAEDTTLAVAAPGALANDYDEDGSPIAATLVSAPSYGTLAFNADGSFVYAPNANFFGTDSFVYRVSDGALQSGNATVTITVNGVQDTPTAADGSVTTLAATDYTFTIADFNYSDVDGDPLAQVEITSLPASGTLLLAGVPVSANQVILAADIAAGNLTYSPPSGAAGTFAEQFGFRVHDGTQYAAATHAMTVGVTVLVTPPPPPPPPVDPVPPPPPSGDPGGSGGTTGDDGDSSGGTGDDGTVSGGGRAGSGGEGAQAPQAEVAAPDKVEAPVQAADAGAGVTAPSADGAFASTGNAASTAPGAREADAAVGRVLDPQAEPMTVEQQAIQAISEPAFREELDKLRRHQEEEATVEARVAGSVFAVSTSLSVGYVIWLLRGGVLLTSLLSSLPAWRIIDPLPVLSRMGGADEDEDDDSLEELVDRNSNGPDSQPGRDADATDETFAEGRVAPRAG